MTSQTSGTGREPARSCAECGTRAEPGQSFCDSCGSVLGWSGSQDPADAARMDSVRARTAAPARNSATGGAADSVAPAAGGPPRESADSPGAADRATGDRPGWDAFARPGAGTGTARTAHDPALARTAGPGGGRRIEDEARWQDDGTGGPGAGDRRERDDPSRSADGVLDEPVGEGRGAGAGPGTRQSDTAHTSGRRETWGSPAGTGAAPSSPPGHGDLDAGPAHASGRQETWGSPTAPAGTGAAPSSLPGHGDLDAGPAHASGRQETWGGPTTPAGTGAAPSSPPRHGDPDVGPAHTSGASAGAGAAALQEWDTASPAAPAPGAAGGAHPGDHRDDTAATEPVPAAAPWDPHSTDSTAERARSLLVPVSDPEPRAPASPAVAPVLPGRPVAARPQVRAPGPESGPTGGIPCPWCATPNLPDRHFCGRCAMPMAGDGRQTPGRLPWWRRTAFFRAAEIPWAGDRPRLRRGFGRVMNWVVGALVLALIVTLVLNVGAGVDATRDHFAKRAPVDPVSVKASRSYPGHGAQLVVDKVSNTWWGPGVTQSGEGQWLEARFDEPTRLLDLIITPGVSTRTQQLSQSALPRRIEARITTADEKTTTRIINLDRSAGGQRRKFRAQEVTSVRFIVRSAYTADDKKQVAIAEIEFFGRSNSNTS